MATIAILSTCLDLHAHVLHEVLCRKGHQAVWFDGPDFPTRMALSLTCDGQTWQMHCEGVDGAIDCAHLRSVWTRRAVDLSAWPEWFNQLDAREAALTQREADALRSNFLALLAPGALWVNRWAHRQQAEHKAWQLQLAMACGFRVPRTLMSNAPARIRAFLAAHRGQAIYKSFRPVDLPTMEITTRELPDDDQALQVAPGTFQARVHKAYELRVTVVGQRVLAYRIDSQQTRLGQLDWRKAYSEVGIHAVTLPTEIEGRCLALCRALNLVYGAIDLIVTPEGEHVFLEVNESGQFLFLEDMAAQQGHATHAIADAIAELLIQGRMDFSWDPLRARRWGAEDGIFAAAVQRKATAMPRHLLPAHRAPEVDEVAARATFNALLARRHAA